MIIKQKGVPRVSCLGLRLQVLERMAAIMNMGKTKSAIHVFLTNISNVSQKSMKNVYEQRAENP